MKESYISSFAIQTHRSNQPHLTPSHTQKSFTNTFLHIIIHLAKIYPHQWTKQSKTLGVSGTCTRRKKAKEYKHNKYVSYVVSHVRICPVLWRTACGDGDGGVECQMRKNKGPWKGWHLSKVLKEVRDCPTGN